MSIATFLFRICHTKTSIGMRSVSSVRIANLLSLTNHLPPEMSASTVPTAMIRTLPPAVMDAGISLGLVCKMSPTGCSQLNVVDLITKARSTGFVLI